GPGARRGADRGAVLPGVPQAVRAGGDTPSDGRAVGGRRVRAAGRAGAGGAGAGYASGGDQLAVQPHRARLARGGAARPGRGARGAPGSARVRAGGRGVPRALLHAGAAGLPGDSVSARAHRRIALQEQRADRHAPGMAHRGRRRDRKRHQGARAGEHRLQHLQPVGGDGNVRGTGLAGRPPPALRRAPPRPPRARRAPRHRADAAGRSVLRLRTPPPAPRARLDGCGGAPPGRAPRRRRPGHRLRPQRRGVAAHLVGLGGSGARSRHGADRGVLPPRV
ncbi:MAG: Aspartate aminotransferase, partial [uncultured Gemmatimonadetes bacterium]